MKKMTQKIIIAAVLLALLACGAGWAGAEEQGVFLIDTFQGGAMGITFTYIDVDETGDMFSLWTMDTVTDVRLEKLTWYGPWISDTELLFAAETLESNQVLNITVDTPDGMPVLRVSAINGQGQPECRYITRGGRDNAPLLLAPDLFPDAENPFSAIAGLPFSFCSGAGAWETVIAFSPDGSFTGNFHDSDMGDSGDDYPFGTFYFCNFTGRVIAAETSLAGCRQLRLVSLERTDPEREAFVEDGVLYVPSIPYGLENADTLWLYTPDTLLSDLPEGFMPWAQLWNFEPGDTLREWGLYNEAEEYAFVAPTAEVLWAE